MRILFLGLLPLIVVGLVGCKPPSSAQVASNFHNSAWMDQSSPKFHGAVVKAAGYDYTKAKWSGVTCNLCHAGNSPFQKSPVPTAPNCYTCHTGGPDGTAGHPSWWADPSNPNYHGAVVKAAVYDFTKAKVGLLTCNTCHAGQNPTQTSPNSRAPNCFTCHPGGPDGTAGHPPGWGGPPSPIYHGAAVLAAGGDYTKARVGLLTCSTCHAGENPAQPSTNSRAPNCFSCHVGGPDGSAGHPPGWAIPPDSGETGNVYLFPTFVRYKIEALRHGLVGDAIHLNVVKLMSDGSTASLSIGAKIAWVGTPILVATDDDAIPPPNAATLLDPSAIPTGFFVRNPARTDHASDLKNVLFVVGDPSLSSVVNLQALVTGGDVGSGAATASISIAPLPPGDVANGQILYAINCATCHGVTGDGGGAGAPDAPGLNNTSPGGQPNLAADPGWNAALLAFASRTDVDNGGISLDLPMVNWLSQQDAYHEYLSTQDFADIYAWLLTQTN